MKERAVVLWVGDEDAGLYDSFGLRVEAVHLVAGVLVGLPVAAAGSLIGPLFGPHNRAQVGLDVRATEDAADGSWRDLLDDAGGVDVVDGDVAVHQHDLLILGGPVLA